MDLIISNSSDRPIYEQIVTQIKELILTGELQPGQKLPSIRALANGLRISVITTKRAYTDLEAQGFIETVQGKGSFVTGGNVELLREERRRQIEQRLMRLVEDARAAGIGVDELREMLDLIMEGDEL
ncbi:GntR family transcriptional regulator [Bifidobacterium pullorum subsp. saeculare]|uniref:GntR family transcriptional regulator n=1 Tax=Bifidobacterium pullorum TaxID=78448 RepID=UPI00195BFEFE|nr:GntR family transcriptional regulator [Bifidobacterium pullorum]MBM6696915.1 GntR family transcriptional regulator [Bifidobacterium pullorum subsp. saeculare]